jgi:hypothetical protein
MQFDADETQPRHRRCRQPLCDDHKIGEGRIERTVPIGFSEYAGMDIGRDNGLVVDPLYKGLAPYALTGTVWKVVFDLKPARVVDEISLHQGASQATAAAGASA